VQSEDGDRVIVKASTPEAQATVDYFALNTAHFDAAASSIRIPFPTGPEPEDSRVDLRTRAWHTAVERAGKLSHEKPHMRRAHQEQITGLIGAYGFWSVWATVLWDRYRDRGLVSALLLPPAAKPAAGMLAVAAEPPSSLRGNAADFPGTRADALFEESESGR
jgi:hypothetical protein